ncbi:uncharacterized protein LOC126898957 [Daktulosphaira vitifoliae]|uniref:uncharacterized protein LOC126898957 n=1 Tax=Daktulosphaira vitifoliae TaxID=58002 RepID=UPI0021A9923D|nr:uncharacterized protein LOC126898957 [Daktulosphaira vitifoliae]XP_050529355.1 uncharacterized protein LOC126898957 [Daktulosphaira vitifoliae]XP_050529356.1 uncharacterized protein LOC126898957 [Daktulosphaira vitifoliae]XP_050529357.1 uncharacterized protein LOC126898957 [Daktulosphaira vitifoliae]
MIVPKPVIKPPITTPNPLIPLRDGQEEKKYISQKCRNPRSSYSKNYTELMIHNKNLNYFIELVDSKNDVPSTIGGTSQLNRTMDNEEELIFDFWSNNTTGFLISVLMIMKNLIIMIYSWLILYGYYMELLSRKSETPEVQESFKNESCNEVDDPNKQCIIQ